MKIRSLNQELWNQLSLDELERRDEFASFGELLRQFIEAFCFCWGPFCQPWHCGCIMDASQCLY